MTSLSAIIDDPCFKTFKELDREAGCPKGSAFRAFKAVAGAWREGEHFHCCDGRIDPLEFARLAAQDRLYPGSVNGVLIGEAMQRTLRERLAAVAGAGARGK